MISTRAPRRLRGRFADMFARHILGLTPDPESWPAPENLSSLPVPVGLIRDGEIFRGRVLDHERAAQWPHRRTLIGAHAYRFTETADYDCGWRLADVASRFLTQQSEARFDILTIVPPAQVYQDVHAVEWCGERLAWQQNCVYRPDLFTLTAPLRDHADRLENRPAPWGDLFRLERPEFVFDKRVLVCDWRWEKGKSMYALAKLLRHAGAEVVCFSWVD